MMRPTSRTGESGGSSGCKASFTPASSATGTARSRNQASVSHSSSSETGAPGAGASSQTAASKPLTVAPPRPRSAVEVRDQETSGIQL